jgi:hypothetical protein
MAVRIPAAEVELALPNDPRSAARARRCVDELHGHAHPETLAKARLLITELVAAGITPEGTDDLQIRMEVTDGRVRGELDPPPPLKAEPSGWGLVLVRRIADRWGTTPDGRVWFEVAQGRRGRFAR